MTWEERPCTPPEIRKYRQSTVHEPGRILRHPGAAGDGVPTGPFGAKTESLVGENVEGVLKTYPETDLGRWLGDRKEALYARYEYVGGGGHEGAGLTRLEGYSGGLRAPVLVCLRLASLYFCVRARVCSVCGLGSCSGDGEGARPSRPSSCELVRIVSALMSSQALSLHGGLVAILLVGISIEHRLR